MKRLPMLIVLEMTIVGLLLGMWGIKKHLPYIPEVDESTFVTSAVRMASSGNLNPNWFGHPGSTTLYPLALGSHIWYATTQNGDLLVPNPDLQTHFDRHISDYYLMGRLLSLLYAVLTLPVTYLLGKRVFSQRTAVIGAWLLLTYTVYWAHAQLTRSDLAATFWGMLALWLCLRAYERPSWQRYIVAGLVVGVSIASRYFMLPLALLLFMVWAAQFWGGRGERQRWKLFRNGILGFLAIVSGFALLTPYFFLDFNTAVANILLEAHSEHLGADSLSKAGNFLWYITTAIPQSISWPQTILALAGIVLAVSSRKPARLLLAAYIFIFLIVISLSPLHWMRWIIQLLPLLALFAASVLDYAAAAFAQRRQWAPRTETIVLLLMVALISIMPLNEMSRSKLRQSTPSTRIAARQWIIENIPSGSKIGLEWYTAPLQGTDYEATELFTLSRGGSVEAYAAEGYDYLVVSANIYDRFRAEPERYAPEIAFYDALFNETDLLQQFDPSLTRGGKSIYIFKLP